MITKKLTGDSAEGVVLVLRRSLAMLRVEKTRVGPSEKLGDTSFKEDQRLIVVSDIVD